MDRWLRRLGPFVAVTVVFALVVLGASSDPAVLVRSTPLAPFLGEQSVERPQDGYELTVPPDWEWEIAGEVDPGYWWDETEVDDVEAFHEGFIADGGLLIARRLAMPDVEENCMLFDVSDVAGMPAKWTTLQDWELAARFELGSDPEIDLRDVAYMDLPAGRALCVDWAEASWGGRDYVFKQDRAWFLLGCGATIPPADLWLPIAESFAFLPESTAVDA